MRTADEVSTFLALAPDDSRVFLYLAHEGSDSSRSWPLAIEVSQQFPHPHLLRYIDSGQTQLEGQSYSYLVSEPVEDYVADVLSERTLTPDETEAVIPAVLSAVGQLHEHFYVHTAITPEAVVAANGAVKLTAAKLKRTIAADETDAKRARASDLIAVGELASLLLSGQSGPAAVLSLPPKFAEFVRASGGTSECPSPTAQQLLDLLDGKPLCAPAPAAPQREMKSPSPPVEYERQPVYTEEVSTEPEKAIAPARRRGNILVAIAALIAISLAVLLSRRADKVTVPAAEVTAPPQAAVQPKKVVPAPAPAPKKSAATPKWAVIAATYSNYDGAVKRAAQINSGRHSVSASVIPPRGEGPRYYVVLGTASSRKEAERLKARAAGAGLPRDTYVTRLTF